MTYFSRGKEFKSQSEARCFFTQASGFYAKIPRFFEFISRLVILKERKRNFTREKMMNSS